jgi:hypothetical protein
MKKVTIEQLLTWAFVHELPKIGAPVADIGAGFSMAWSVMSEVAALGTIVDRSPNAYGVIPGFVTMGDPHPDAVLVGEAVNDLADRGGFEIGEGWNPFPEWSDEHGLIAAEVSRAVAALRLKRDALGGRHVVNLVRRCAILGRGPDWTATQPKVRMVTAKGKPAWFVMKKKHDSLRRVYLFEANGFDERKQRPVKGAYRKYELSEPITGDILSRLDWQLWQDALEQLHEELSGRLVLNDLLPFRPDRAPWLTRNRAAMSSQPIEKA